MNKSSEKNEKLETPQPKLSIPKNRNSHPEMLYEERR